ncbi:uncharacterized protein MELLADRAFT_60729 [Melampsora larici-populina 98AG31]|uniref:Uncharacterized protein n=1 Tax=Melampsora larici-populina (strain 98AG31 / pathotype 3-4-7) TaxID=747676 RepID=F4RC48_MELLP|nr:uncharacterized protein MELLADRAFT_60729 [Melampsora larici-populina 98AG31]EGG10215.1 hypothetical protein MELLADRAFT_60729 [Melampsora larici-populina 98AG31]
MGRHSPRRPSLSNDSLLPVSKKKTTTTSSPAKSNSTSRDRPSSRQQATPFQNRKDPTQSHGISLRGLRTLSRPQIRKAISPADAPDGHSLKPPSSYTLHDEEVIKPSASNMSTTKRRLPAIKSLTPQQSSEKSAVPQSTNRTGPLRPPGQLNSNLRHPSAPLSISKQRNTEPPPKSFPSQTPIRRVSGRKVIPGTTSQDSGLAKHRHVSPTAVTQKSTHKSRLPIATPTTTVKTNATSSARVRTSISAVDLSSHQPHGLQKELTTSSESHSDSSKSTTSSSNIPRRSSVNGALNGNPEDLPRSSSSSSLVRTTRRKKPHSPTDSESSMSESTKINNSLAFDEEANEIAESKKATQSIGIILSPVAEELPRRPMTRARSKHLLGYDNRPPLEASKDVPSVRRRPSRVMELAQSFEDPTVNSGTSRTPSITNVLSSSNMGYTPNRKSSGAFSSASTASPHSPNIMALAATLSKQHVQRDRQSRVRSSISDMLRYSTMSTLGTLRWEDGAGDGLLTDDNETEAMVADISLVESTPVRPETEKAALALATARSNFLIVAKEDESLKMSGYDHNAMSSPSISLNHRGRLSANYSPSPLANATQASHDPFNQNVKPSSLSKFNGLVAQEAQLAFLSAELEAYQTREAELQRQLQQAQTLNQAHSAEEKDPEREILLVEEMTRLEDEIHNMTEVNIDLENHVDRVNFENEELKSKEELMRKEIDGLKENLKELKKVETIQERRTRKTEEVPQLPIPLISLQIQKAQESERVYLNETQSEIEIIKSQLMTLNLIKLSLSLQDSIAEELDNAV